MYCGECNVTVPETMEGWLANCPTCRAPSVVLGNEVSVERLLRLVARSPGRHTPRAQSELGALYENGTGVVPQDHTEALRLYRLAADQGHIAAQCRLAWMYKNGNGISQDHTEAVRWCRLAADQGDARAQCALGLMHTGGTGIPHRRRASSLCVGVGLPNLAAPGKSCHAPR